MKRNKFIARAAALALLLASASTAWAAGTNGFEYDSRRVFDLCSPDQIASPGEVRFDWGHYSQWTTVNGTASGPGSFLAAPWNTCLESPDYSHLEWKGRGKITFQIRSAPDGSPKDRNQPGSWSEWLPLGSPREIRTSGSAPLPDSTIPRGEGKRRLEIPAAPRGRRRGSRGCCPSRDSTWCGCRGAVRRRRGPGCAGGRGGGGP